jgi:hypothetical protein
MAGGSEKSLARFRVEADTDVALDEFTNDRPGDRGKCRGT